MTAGNRACGTCTYFEKNVDVADEGECRRYAPRPASDRRETMWVAVAITDWCGEYTAG